MPKLIYLIFTTILWCNDVGISFFLQMRKLRCEDIRYLVLGHMASQQRSKTSNQTACVYACGLNPYAELLQFLGAFERPHGFKKAGRRRMEPSSFYTHFIQNPMSRISVSLSAIQNSLMKKWNFPSLKGILTTRHWSKCSADINSFNPY